LTLRSGVYFAFWGLVVGLLFALMVLRAQFRDFSGTLLTRDAVEGYSFLLQIPDFLIAPASPVLSSLLIFWCVVGFLILVRVLNPYLRLEIVRDSVRFTRLLLLLTITCGIIGLLYFMPYLLGEGGGKGYSLTVLIAFPSVLFLFLWLLWSYRGIASDFTATRLNRSIPADVILEALGAAVIFGVFWAVLYMGFIRHFLLDPSRWTDVANALYFELVNFFPPRVLFGFVVSLFTGLGLLFGLIIGATAPTREDPPLGFWDTLPRRALAPTICMALLFVGYQYFTDRFLTQEYQFRVPLLWAAGIQSQPPVTYNLVPLEGKGRVEPRVVPIVRPGSYNPEGAAKMNAFIMNQKRPTFLTRNAYNYLINFHAWDLDLDHCDQALLDSSRVPFTNFRSTQCLLEALSRRPSPPTGFAPVADNTPPGASTEQVRKEIRLAVQIGNQDSFEPQGKEACLRLAALYAHLGLKEADYWAARSKTEGAAKVEIDKTLAAAKPRMSNGEISGRILVNKKPVTGIKVRLMSWNQVMGTPYQASSDPAKDQAGFWAGVNQRLGIWNTFFSMYQDTRAAYGPYQEILAVAVTDQDGNFTFKGLDQGVYAMVVRLPGGSQKVTVKNSPDLIFLDQNSARAALGDIEMFF